MSSPLLPVACDVVQRTELEIRGADRMKFLHSFCTNDIQSLTPGRGCEAFITSSQGKTLSHVLVTCEAERLRLDTVAEQAETIRKHLERFVITEDVTFTDSAATRSLWLVGGEGSEDRLRALVGEVPTEYLSWREVTLAGAGALVQRVAIFGTESFLLRGEGESCSRWASALAAAGFALPREAREDSDGAPSVSTTWLEGLRIDARWPQFGWDIVPDNLPQEIARDRWAISFKKGCYLGQETVARLDALGHVNKHLAVIRFGATALPPRGMELVREEKVVGQVTSAGFSPRWQCPIAFAMLRAAHAKPGTELASAVGVATVV